MSSFVEAAFTLEPGQVVKLRSPEGQDPKVYRNRVAATLGNNVRRRGVEDFRFTTSLSGNFIIVKKVNLDGDTGDHHGDEDKSGIEADQE